MKIREGKKILAYDFVSSEWVKSKIISIDLKEGVVEIQYTSGNNSGKIWHADITELSDKDCFKDK